MSTYKPPERTAKHERVLDAASRLLARNETADFSMRDLAEEAGVSFATPFNYFGSKIAIMHALSNRLIDTMTERFLSTEDMETASARVLTAFDIAVSVLLEEPAVTKPVIGSLGSPTTEPGGVADRSRALWANALGDFAGIRQEMTALAAARLPTYLAHGFRGSISFWVAGEIPDSDLRVRASCIAAALLLSFVEADQQDPLLQILRADRSQALPDRPPL